MKLAIAIIVYMLLAGIRMSKKDVAGTLFFCTMAIILTIINY